MGAEKSKYEDDILRSLRKITRAIDLHSRQLASQYGLTGPQLICMRILKDQGELTPTMIAKEMSLSQGTVTGVVDRLFSRGLVTRVSKNRDRRSHMVTLTPEGVKMVKNAPSPLQESFALKLRAIPVENQLVIHTILRQIVSMMGAEKVEAAPVLSSGPATIPAKEVQAFLDHIDEKDEVNSFQNVKSDKNSNEGTS